MRDSYMKILVERAFFAAVLVFSAVLSADVVSDRHLVFWTNGPDRYADGSSVQNGECYALVCTKAGATFAGFNADGTLVDVQASTLVHVAPLALKGHCRYTDFVVDGAFADAHAGDVWKVYLLDTRRRGGALAPLDENGRPTRVNGYGPTDSEVRSGSSGMTATAALQSMNPGSVADVRSSDAFAPRPRITGMRLEDGKVVLTVADTVPSLDYDLAGGATPDALAAGVAQEPVEGAATRTITLRADAAAGAGFFKVIRAK